MSTTTPVQEHYDTSSVFVAVIGRPNVGKSSLTNLLVGEKVAIVTSKPQTTRTRITGVITRGPLQYVLLDTPGVHKAHNKLGKRMDKTASDSIADVDVSMMLFEPYGALNESEMALVEALHRSGPAIAVINKTDLVKEPADLETRKAELKALGVFDEIYTSFQPIAEAKGLRFVLNLKPEETGQVYMGDPIRIRQVVGNLLSNAIKFTEKGTITLEMISCKVQLSGYQNIDCTL